MAAIGMNTVVNNNVAVQLHQTLILESMYDCKCIANQAHAMETPTPKKRTLGLAHYFVSVKKQKSEEHLTKDEDSQNHAGLQEVKEEEVKTEKDDKECEKDVEHTTPRMKYTRDDFVKWGKKGGRPSSGQKNIAINDQLVDQKGIARRD